MKVQGLLRACLLAAACVPVISVAQDTTWTLERCLSEAVTRSPRLRAGTRTVQAAEAAARGARADRLPTLGTTASYSYTSETMELDIPLPTIPGYTPPRVSFGDGNVYDLAVSARVPIFAGHTVRERARAETEAWQAAQNDFAADSLKLLYEVRRAYFVTVGAEAQVETARRNSERLERHLQELVGAKDIGFRSEEDRVAAVARSKQAESALLAAESDAQAARLALGNLVGASGAEIRPDGDLSARLVSDATTEVRLESRPEVTALAARMRQSDHIAKASTGTLFPSLAATAAYHYGKPGVNQTQNDWMDYYTLGVNASWTLWDWRARSHRAAQARALARVLDARQTDLINAIQTLQATSREALAAAQSILIKSSERLDLDRRRLTMVEGRYRAGMASESEYLDAQDDLADAETNVTAARVRLRLAEADLLYASGH